MNNTLAINGEDHARRLGAGLVEGLLADTFDYAAGHSGRALDHGAFTRSLILVHSQGGCGGYFIVFDEVEADPGDKIHVYLQTASTTEPAAVAAHEYVVEVNHHAKVEGVKLAVLYAGEPERVMHEMIDSGFLERIPEAGRHYRQEVIFGTDPQGNRRLVTVLFPHDPAHPKAQLSRIAGDGYTGATVGLGHGVTDFVAESDGEQRVTAGNLTFRARAVVHRLHDDDGEAFYFARAGRELRHGSRGFTSDQPVSIFMKGGHGRITSRRGGEVTLHHPGVTGVQVSGEAVEGTQTGDGWVRFTLPTGDHEVTLLFGD